MLIIVSSGPEDVRVPVVVGRTEAQARNTLTEIGLIPVVSYQDGNFGPAEDGRVISQSLPVRLAGSRRPPRSPSSSPATRAATDDDPTDHHHDDTPADHDGAPTTTAPATTTTVP